MPSFWHPHQHPSSRPNPERAQRVEGGVEGPPHLVVACSTSLLVFAVILSAAKDPDTSKDATTARIFLPENSSPSSCRMPHPSRLCLTRWEGIVRSTIVFRATANAELILLWPLDVVDDDDGRVGFARFQPEAKVLDSLDDPAEVGVLYGGCLGVVVCPWQGLHVEIISAG
jgi:hypothetical protein